MHHPWGLCTGLRTCFLLRERETVSFRSLYVDIDSFVPRPRPSYSNSHIYLVIALLVGIALGPHGANLIRPLSYAEGGKEENLDAINLAFARLVLGVQLVLAGVQLPKKYLTT